MCTESLLQNIDFCLNNSRLYSTCFNLLANLVIENQTNIEKVCKYPKILEIALHCMLMSWVPREIFIESTRLLGNIITFGSNEVIKFLVEMNILQLFVDIVKLHDNNINAVYFYLSYINKVLDVGSSICYTNQMDENPFMSGSWAGDQDFMRFLEDLEGKNYGPLSKKGVKKYFQSACHEANLIKDCLSSK